MKRFTSLFFMLSLVANLFAGSGIFLRGESNSWGALPEWEFQETSEAGVYTLANVTLKSGFKIADANWSLNCNYGAGSSSLVTPGVEYQLVTDGGNLSLAKTTECELITFNANKATVIIKEKEAAPVEVAGPALWPASVVLSKAPEKVKVLSMNNSLIHYENEWQDDIFNQMAAAMGKDAFWTAHTNLGKTLDYHYDEGEGLTEAGTPSARMLVRTNAYTHIILQEQTAKPRTNLAGFRESVKKWVKYIREEGANPNAHIIIPINWAYNDYSTFTQFNADFVANYKLIAEEFGVTITPVGIGYQKAFEAEGAVGMAAWFKDDRHPTQQATYMAACMEYATIFGVDPTTITWYPTTITADVAAKMRSYAKQAIEAYEQTVDQKSGTIRYNVHILDVNGMSTGRVVADGFAVNGGGSMNGNIFTSDNTLGTYETSVVYNGSSLKAGITVAEQKTVVVETPSISVNEQNKTVTQNFDSLPMSTGTPDAKGAYTVENNKMPEGWRIERNEVGPRTIGTFAGATETVQYAGGDNLPSNAYNGTWNLGAKDSSDRAVGGMTTGVANGARTINVMAHLKNDGTTKFESLNIDFDVEKYRDGSNENLFYVKLFTSKNGNTWTDAGNAFTFTNPKGSGQTGFATVPAAVSHISGKLNYEFVAGTDLYLCWSISTSAGDNCASAPCLAIDNVSIQCNVPSMPVSAHYIYVDDQTGYETLALYAWGDAEIYGGWPGTAKIGDKEINGKNYKVFPLDITTNGSYNLIFNNYNNGSQLPDFNITEARDYVLQASASGVKEIDIDAPEPVQPEEPDYAAIELNANAASYSQDFNSLPCPGADAQIIEKGYVSAEPSELPTGWRIERNQIGPRTIGAYANAATATQYQGGVSLPSNAANGTWNFGMNGDTDRAVGGMTTSVANGARTINVMAAFKNTADEPITELDIAYDIEKYRDGTNANAFYVKLFTSEDGMSWAAAEGDAFTFINPSAAATAGFATVPAAVTPVSGTIAKGIEAGKWFYLCWSICTSTGSDCAGAPALAVDNVQLSAKYGAAGLTQQFADNTANVIYNVQGIRTVAPSTKGIYIQNGKKFAVR